MLPVFQNFDKFLDNAFAEIEYRIQRERKQPYLALPPDVRNDNYQSVVSVEVGEFAHEITSHRSSRSCNHYRARIGLMFRSCHPPFPTRGPPAASIPRSLATETNAALRHSSISILSPKSQDLFGPPGRFPVGAISRFGPSDYGVDAVYRQRRIILEYFSVCASLAQIGENGFTGNPCSPHDYGSPLITVRSSTICAGTAGGFRRATMTELRCRSILTAAKPPPDK